MLDMATPKKTPRQRKGKALNVWINADLRDALDAAVDRTRPRSSLKDVVEMILEDWLREQGLLSQEGK